MCVSVNGAVHWSKLLGAGKWSLYVLWNLFIVMVKPAICSVYSPSSLDQANHKWCQMHNHANALIR